MKKTIQKTLFTPGFLWMLLKQILVPGKSNLQENSQAFLMNLIFQLTKVKSNTL